MRGSPAVTSARRGGCEHAGGAVSVQGGLFSCSLPLDAIINGRERRAAQPIRSLLACQPKTNCLLALTAAFYLHNSNPKAKANLHFANSDRRSRVCGSTHAGRSGERVGRGGGGGLERKKEKKNPVGSNRTAAESIAVTRSSRQNTFCGPDFAHFAGFGDANLATAARFFDLFF